MKRFWDGTSSRNAHLGLDGDAEYLFARYKSLITDKIKVKGKTVIDFGHGGGLLGKYLLSDCGVKKYIGYDIAERSNKVASENMKEFDNKELILLKEHVWNFAEKEPDIIIALAVMIHFPTRVYLDNFLRTVNDSGARDAVLEIRDKGHGTLFQVEPYSDGCFRLNPRSCLTCDTSEEYISSKLPNYDLKEFTDPVIAPTNCQVLWFKRK